MSENPRYPVRHQNRRECLRRLKQSGALARLALQSINADWQSRRWTDDPQPPSLRVYQYEGQ